MNQTDDALIAAYLKGSMPAFESLFGRYERPVLRFIVSLGGSREQAQDAAQTTWLKVVEGLGAYEARGRFRPWLFRIAHRAWLDHVRGAWQRRRILVGEGNESDFEGLPIDRTAFGAAISPADAAAAREERDQLYDALAGLPCALRQTVLLRIDAEMTFAEIAEAMDCPLGTALWRAHEAERRLKDALGAEK
ncbi:MAG TPA: sigma-70 family RNA polymerase sigma factor [Candidatus Hydrogenedentes bacterium]|nr:sigma-70 family RNA polymerase sigma factor [Candidatus Hydrogenedentota bacterium]HPG66766.1 sigma-70 family RNA polymerase sigma factor [Candidatus Hydrogenedentota bacterium]